MRQFFRQAAVRTILISAWLLVAGSAAADNHPADWLNRMAAAVQSTSYKGTVIRIRDGKVESLKVVHTIEDGVVREKVVAQEGRGIEIIRHGNEVHCIVPDRQSVLIEDWDDQSTLFSTLPKSKVVFGSEYDALLVREERVAGRQAMLLAIRPHDEFRYGHRIWLDNETGFPLKTQLINESGGSIEQVKFVDIELNREIQASALASSYSTENYTWLRQPSGHVVKAAETDWSSSDLPAGFAAVSTHEDELPDGDTVTHIMFSDGLADVSVFIAPASGKPADGASTIGGSNSYSATTDGHEVTAIGEVPAATVHRIATTMRKP